MEVAVLDEAQLDRRCSGCFGVPHPLALVTTEPVDPPQLSLDSFEWSEALTSGSDGIGKFGTIFARKLGGEENSPGNYQQRARRLNHRTLIRIILLTGQQKQITSEACRASESPVSIGDASGLKGDINAIKNTKGVLGWRWTAPLERQTTFFKRALLREIKNKPTTPPPPPPQPQPTLNIAKELKPLTKKLEMV
ncbi:unnamed protein product [Spodoptera exigua]|nr:unnamed protein product [Spodoptera exigua]